MKQLIEKWYRHGLWTAEQVHDAVHKGVLSESEYLAIIRGE